VQFGTAICVVGDLAGSGGRTAGQHVHRARSGVVVCSRVPAPTPPNSQYDQGPNDDRGDHRCEAAVPTADCAWLWAALAK
jgi:hypothetical protein